MIATIVIVVALLVVLLGIATVVVPRRRAAVLEPPSTRRGNEAAEVSEAATIERDELTRASVDATLLERPVTARPAEDVVEDVAVEDVVVGERPRLRDRLGRARAALAGTVGSIAGRSRIDAETWDELEEALILADVGVGSTQDLLDHLRTRVKADGLSDGEQLLAALKAEMKDRLRGFDRGLHRADGDGPSVWLFVGVNGVGKTTTIGKLGARERAEGRSVLMAAGDTFRAAAAEQLGMWAERCGAEIVRGAEGGDPSAVIFDGVEAANARGIDLVLADTAGRLHTKVNLMDELGKVRRVADKGAGTVTEVLLVIDATTGQNGLVQARQFTDAVELTGVVLTKLDGSAKGGIVLAIHEQLGIPVKLVGLGEGAEDLVPFDADEFVEALFA